MRGCLVTCNVSIPLIEGLFSDDLFLGEGMGIIIESSNHSKDIPFYILLNLSGVTCDFDFVRVKRITEVYLNN